MSELVAVSVRPFVADYSPPVGAALAARTLSSVTREFIRPA